VIVVGAEQVISGSWRSNYTKAHPDEEATELPHKKGNFVKDRCLKKDVTWRWRAFDGIYAKRAASGNSTNFARSSKVP
jgi:hypothetical protein